MCWRTIQQGISVLWWITNNYTISIWTTPLRAIVWVLLNLFSALRLIRPAMIPWWTSRSSDFYGRSVCNWLCDLVSVRCGTNNTMYQDICVTGNVTSSLCSNGGRILPWVSVLVVLVFIGYWGQILWLVLVNDRMSAYGSYWKTYKSMTHNYSKR